MNTVATKEIMNRFYCALDVLIETKKIRGVATYCRESGGIDRRNFLAQRKDMDRGWFQLSWLQLMVKEYEINAKWLLTGIGKMFDK